jgi:hypothetical protein
MFVAIVTAPARPRVLLRVQDVVLNALPRE